MLLKNDSLVLAQIRNVEKKGKEKRKNEKGKKKAQLDVISIGKWLMDLP